MGWDGTPTELSHGFIHITAPGVFTARTRGLLGQGWHTTYGQDGERTGPRTDIIGWEYLPACLS